MWLNMANVRFDPTWKKFEKDIYSDDSNKARQAAEAFDETRKQELKTSESARRWEKSRRESVAKDKPTFVKNRLKTQQDEALAPLMALKKGGTFETGLVPMPGYVIVHVPKEDIKTDSGLYLSEAATVENKGVVVAIGGEKLLENGNTVSLPAKPGDRVMFKRGAGLEIEVKGLKARFMMFTDILAVIDDE